MVWTKGKMCLHFIRALTKWSWTCNICVIMWFIRVKVVMDLLEIEDIQVQEVFLEMMDSLNFLEHKDLLDKLVVQIFLSLQGHKEKMEKKETRVRLEIQVNRKNIIIIFINFDYFNKFYLWCKNLGYDIQYKYNLTCRNLINAGISCPCFYGNS